MSAPADATAQGALARARARLDACGQGHLLHFWESLSGPARTALLTQLDQLPLEEIPDMLARSGAEKAPDPASLSPVSCVTRSDAEHERWTLTGEAMIRAGEVAAFTVAGGQGTRLGWRGPKGTYPATVLTGKPLFRTFAEQLLAVERRYGVSIPWYIMTSPQNDAETRAFFQDNNHFGRRASDHFLFPQGVVPSVDPQGRALLASPSEVATNPDGHGGSLRALHASGALMDMSQRGVRHISYFQVDNPLVRIMDPLFLGMHAAHPASGGEMSSKVVPKRDAAEKVGVLCRGPGPGGASVVRVIEYSDLPRQLAEARDAAGRLRFDAGNIAVHVLSVAFVARLNQDEGHFGLPWHRALKKIPCVDLASGAVVEPAAPNGIKFETFVFDALTRAERPLVLETSRDEEFAPIKNADGEDSPASSHRMQSERAARWLAACGVRIPRRPDGSVDARLEIGPLTALAAEDLRGAALPAEITRGADLVF